MSINNEGTSVVQQVQLRAVLDDPDAVEPRLAFAATCAATGESERAEFIRLQIETADRMRRGRDDWWEPATLAEKLLRAHRDAWAGPIRNRGAWQNFYRGFVEEIEVDAREFLAHASELYELAPIRRLSLKGVKSVVRELFGSPHLARIVSLSMEGQKLDDDDLRVVAASPFVARLASLGIGHNHVTVGGIEALAASDALPALKKVSLIDNPASALAEDIGYDQGAIIDARSGSADVDRLEQKYGRKTWLHTVEDHGMRQLHDAEL